MKRLVFLPVAALLLTACGNGTNNGAAAVGAQPAPELCSTDVRDNYTELRKRYEAVNNRSDAFKSRREIEDFLTENQGVNCDLNDAEQDSSNDAIPAGPNKTASSYQKGHRERRQNVAPNVLNEKRLQAFVSNLERDYQIQPDAMSRNFAPQASALPMGQPSGLPNGQFQNPAQGPNQINRFGTPGQIGRPGTMGYPQQPNMGFYNPGAQ